MTGKSIPSERSLTPSRKSSTLSPRPFPDMFSRGGDSCKRHRVQLELRPSPKLCPICCRLGAAPLRPPSAPSAWRPWGCWAHTAHRSSAGVSVCARVCSIVCVLVLERADARSAQPHTPHTVTNACGPPSQAGLPILGNRRGARTARHRKQQNRTESRGAAKNVKSQF